MSEWSQEDAEVYGDQGDCWSPEFWIEYILDGMTFGLIEQTESAFRLWMHERTELSESRIDCIVMQMQDAGVVFGSPRNRNATRSYLVGKKLRFQILKRDKYRCRLCGGSAKDGATLHVDHITPKAKGGTNDRSNLWTLCRDCNLGKGVEEL